MHANPIRSFEKTPAAEHFNTVTFKQLGDTADQLADHIILASGGASEIETVLRNLNAVRFGTTDPPQQAGRGI